MKKMMMFVIAGIMFSYSVLASSYTFAEGEKQAEVPYISRNPFVNAPYSSPKKDQSGTQKYTIGDAVKSMKVKGILIGKDYTKAIIGHRIVKAGDEIGEFTVSEITRSGVTLLYGDRVFHVFME